MLISRLMYADNHPARELPVTASTAIGLPRISLRIRLNQSLTTSQRPESGTSDLIAPPGLLGPCDPYTAPSLRGGWVRWGEILLCFSGKNQ